MSKSILMFHRPARVFLLWRRNFSCGDNPFQWIDNKEYHNTTFRLDIAFLAQDGLDSMHMRIGEDNQSSLECFDGAQWDQPFADQCLQIRMTYLTDRGINVVCFILEERSLEFQFTALQGLITMQNVQTRANNLFMTHSFDMPNTLIGLIRLQFIIHNLCDHLKLLTSQRYRLQIKRFQLAHPFSLFLFTELFANSTNIAVDSFQIGQGLSKQCFQRPI
mmetsp:Transcript_10790/g.25008  ORF Transcript_10790/g.25008 Transcript_10790/m.25008 type:complete len:219 (-) Transcript_10790:65-721(-)